MSSKRNRQKVVDTRWEKKEKVGRKTSDKHMEDREVLIKRRPINPMNQQQAEYIDNLRNLPYNIAVGYAGTSKTYLATRVAIEKLLLEEIDKIIIVRPAVSDSKSLGFFGGDQLQKMKNWILPVLDVLEEFLGKGNVENMLAKGTIVPVPLETIKGRSFKNSFIIIDESEDLTEKEVIKCITRLAANSFMVFAGDIKQVDLKEGSGLSFALGLADDESLYDDWGVVDFDNVNEIVRSEAVKRSIVRLTEMGKM
jgi:phosphate starvation-inducible PhoH-like protein